MFIRPLRPGVGRFLSGARCRGFGGALFFLASGTLTSQAAFLNDNYLNPANAGLVTQYSSWNNDLNFNFKFYATNGYANSPTTSAPYGNYTTASAAGVVYPGPGAWSPAHGIWTSANPSAFFDSRNATITQTGAPSNVYTGIYSSAGVMNFKLNNAVTYDLGTVVFQFQTLGTPVDYSSIQLRYTDGTGTHTLSANEMIKEYAGGASSYGGNDTRVALQWKLTGLGIRTYEIVWDSAGSSMSFVQALLDTSANYATVVPASGNWTAGGNGNWSDTARWAQNATNLNFVPQANGNATFSNTAAAAINLDGNRTVGSIVFDTAADTSITSTAYTLTANTGITTTSQATGTYLIETAYALNALNVFDIEAGRVVMNRPITSTGNYGLVKQGEGILELRANNSFTGGLNVSGGILRVAGNNTYGGSTTVGYGNLVVAANAGTTGALGSTATAIFVGLDSSIHSGDLPAGVIIEGNNTISRSVTFSGGTFRKTLGAIEAPTGATFSGVINFGTSANVRFNAATATDKLNFTGGMSSGSAAGTVLIDGAGMVTYGGTSKNYSYADATNVASGTLNIDSGATFTGNGNMTVGEDAQLLVHGTLNGTGSLQVDGGTIGGSGTINRTFTLNNGDVLSPGNSPGTLRTVDETWGSGATLKLEMNDVDAGAGTGWDNISITGGLSLTATTSSKFKLELHSLTALNAPGLFGDFNPNSNYSWQFLTVSNAITGFEAGAFEIDAGNFLNSAGVFSVTLGGDNKSLSLQYLAVPEPSSTMLALCGAVFFLNRRRRATPRR